MSTKTRPNPSMKAKRTRKAAPSRSVPTPSVPEDLRHTAIPEAPDAGVQDPRYQEAHECCDRGNHLAEAPDAGESRGGGHQFIEGEFTHGRSQS